MADQLYWAQNGAMQTTAAPVPTPTNAAIKTHLQVATPATLFLDIVEWGISFDGSAAATPIRCELIVTDVACTGLTAHVASGVQAYNDSNLPASAVTLGTGATGYNLTTATEGTPTATRTGDLQFIAPTNQYVFQWPLGREFRVPASRFLRIRTTAAATVNCYCYVIWNE